MTQIKEFSTFAHLTSSSSSKSPCPSLKRPPLEPNGEKSSSVNLGGGNKMSSSSVRKQCCTGSVKKDVKGGATLPVIPAHRS